MNQLLNNAALETVELLKKNGLTVATAESCTGGIISGYITSVPGASSVFELGITSYSSRIKNKVLNVKTDTLKSHGAVSRQTATEMAAHVRLIADADIGISVTGVAGPDSSEGKLPGTVYIALANNKKVWVEKLSIEPESRNFVREAATEAIFGLIKKYVSERKEEQ